MRLERQREEAARLERIRVEAARQEIEKLSRQEIEELCDGETPLDHTMLNGLGPKKVARLAAVRSRQYPDGIRTVEQLALVDVGDRGLVEAVTGNRRFDRARETLSKWKKEAVAFLKRKKSGE